MTRRHPVPPARTERGERRTVLLTGASGVVGQAVSERLGDMRVLALTHRSDPGPGMTKVPGDVRRPRLGLERRALRRLAGELDCVVHAAACTRFDAPLEEYRSVNVEGTRNVLEVAAAAGVPVVHVSTAFVHEAVGGDGVPSMGYRDSKIEAEASILDSGLDTVVLRPSVVVGDSATGRTSGFQGIYRVLAALQRGWIPLAPVDPASYVDIVPRDHVAEVVRQAVLGVRPERELWLTLGPAALTIGQVLQVAWEECCDYGTPPPRFVEREVYDRLYEPVFLPAFPAAMRATTRRLLEMLEHYLALREPLPTSARALERVGIGVPVPPATVLRRSFRYWQRVAGGDAPERRRGRTAGLGSERV